MGKDLEIKVSRSQGVAQDTEISYCKRYGQKRQENPHESQFLYSLEQKWRNLVLNICLLTIHYLNDREIHPVDLAVD